VTLFELGFMRNALIAGAFVGLAAPAIGIFLVQRRLALMGDGIGHVAFTGVAAGILTNTAPIGTAIVAAVLGAVLIETMRARGRTQGDVALALIFYGGIAGGVFLASFADSRGSGLFGYLFGSVLTVSRGELIAVAIVCALVVALTTGLRKELFAVSYDEEVARVSGLPVRALNMTIAITAAVTIAVTMKVVGILLVSAMLVVPVAAVQQLTRTFGATFVGSMLLGVFVCVGGLIAAYYLDVYPASTIVLSAIVAFLLAALAGRFTRPGS
jgi:zinc transport system permease protein